MKDLSSMASEFKSIYVDIPEYQELREEDRKFFDNLFILLLFNEEKAYSNKYLSQRFSIPLSTIEKRIKRLDRAKLIKRKVVNELQENGRWLTKERTIELDSVTFAFVKARTETARIQGARQAALDKGKFIPREAMDTAKEEAMDPTTKPVEIPEDEISTFRRMLANIC